VSFLDLSSRKTKSLKSDELRLANNNWGLAFNLDEQTITLVNKIRAGKSNLKNAVDIISQGLIAYDARRGQDEFTIKNRVYHHDNSASNQVHGKWLWGADVTPYSVKWNGEERLDYCDGIANPRQKEYFDGSRILVREITNPKIYAGYTEAQYYHDPAVILIKDRKENLLPILGILNSKLATYFHFNSSPKATKGDFPKILVKDIKDFPLPDIDDEVKSRLSMKVSAIRNIIAANSYVRDTVN